jgi:hypothetical protein
MPVSAANRIDDAGEHSEPHRSPITTTPHQPQIHNT